MMERAKTLSAGSTGSARHVYLKTMLAYFVLFIVMRTLTSIGNKSTIPGERIFDPAFGIMMACVVTAGFVGITYYHLTRTDEHDRRANLWTFAIAFLAYFAILMPWGVLSQSGLVGPVNPQHAMVIAISIGSMVWVWLRWFG
jgi:hypothetical protein